MLAHPARFLSFVSHRFGFPFGRRFSIHRFAQILSLQATVLYTSSLTVKKVSTKHTTTMLFFICHIHIPGSFFLFLIKCEYFCRRFTSGILNYKQDESTNINKRDGKKKDCFISRFPYFPAYHGWIWISGTDLWHLHAWIGLQLPVPDTARQNSTLLIPTNPSHTYITLEYIFPR